MPEGVGYSGSNVIAGAGLELNYIGTHCYAFSGGFGANTSEQTLFEFTTGKEYIIGTLTINGGTELATAGNGTISAYQLSLNGVIVAVLKTETATEDQPTTVMNELLIPPYTNVKLIMDSASNDSGSLNTAIIVGKLY